MSPVRRAFRAAESDSGSATIVVTAVVAVAFLVVAGALAAAGFRVATVRAHAAADAAALAAAASVVGLVPGDPCVLAARVATAHRAAVDTCRTAASTARLRVLVRGGPFAVGAVAVAGPADDRPELYVYGVAVGPRSPVPRSTRTRS